MKSLFKFLFILAISVGFMAPMAQAKKAHKASHRSELPHKKDTRKPAAHKGKKHAKKSNKKKSHKKHRASAGELKARQYFISTGG